MGRSLELFTGAGGLALASHLSGFHHEGLFEWNPDACETLRHNAARHSVKGIKAWRNLVTEGDISGVDFRRFEGVDLVAGGPPCQPFSLGGLHAGKEDHRDMIPHFIRAVREAKPKAFIMENVRGLTRKAFTTYLEYSRLQLTYPEATRKPKEGWERHLRRLQQHFTSSPRSESLTYNLVFSGVRNAADYGVPQCRDRIFLVGFRNDIDAHWGFPLATHSQDRLMHDQWVTGSYWDRFKVARPSTPASIIKRLEELRRAKGPQLQPWNTVRGAIADLPAPFVDRDHSDEVFNHRHQKGARPYPGHTGSPLDGPSKALKAGGHGVPGGENMIAFPDGSYRYLTVREAARVQTFPDSWQFKGAWSEAMRQLGNAVPVDLARVVTDSVARKLASVRRTSES